MPRLLLIALSLAALTSCGGGGGGGGGSSGTDAAFPAVQAHLTAANAARFARFAELAARVTTADGFVDISTGATRPQLFIHSTGPQGGPVIMTGATTVATVTYNGAAPAAISIAPR